MNSIDDIKQQLIMSSDWSALNAYEMTKRACAELTKHGHRVPSWNVIRDIIGKGSAGDINRGKDDFRKEHGEEIRKLTEIPGGVPEILSTHIMGLWQAAIDFVRIEFDDRVQEWKKTVDEANAKAEQADSERISAVNHAETLTAENAGLHELIETIKGQVETERAGKLQAEKMFEAHTVEVNRQREQLEEALKNNQTELAAALTRFDGERRRSMMEIEEARTKANKAIAQATEQFNRDKSSLELNTARLNQQIADARSKTLDLEKKLALSQQEVSYLKQKLQEEIERKKHDETLSASSPRGALIKHARRNIAKPRRALKK